MKLLQVILILVLMVPSALLAQGQKEAVINLTTTSYLRVDVLVGMLDVLSGGMPAVETADLLEDVISQDLELSGLFRTGWKESQADSMEFLFTIEGSVEGPLRDAEITGEVVANTVTLNLLSYPERQLLLSKRYRPIPSQTRKTAHHFSNEVIEMISGDPGIALTRVVFSRGTGDRRDLYAVDYDGEEILRLTANRTLNLCPNWSPDNAEIVFTSYRNGQQGIFSLDTSNGKVRTIISQEGINLGASWHPDGGELLLSLTRGSNPEIFRITPEGKIVKRLTVMKSIEIDPCWSPSGKDVIFTSDRSGTPQLYMMGNDGIGVRRLTFEGRYNDSAMWSPLGDRIIYASREGNYTHIVLMRPNGEDRKVLTDSTWRNAEDPCWAPDGRHIVFTSDRTGIFKLYVYDVVDDIFRQLTFGDEPDITPAWSN